jgi:signal transduction histidine kinase
MAGSYAHNIKNLLVRPNDLLRRCLEAEGVPEDQESMLREVQSTLGMVTERLQQILHTVRRDPSKAELKPIDLGELARALVRTWGQLAADRWQLDVELQPEDGLMILGDDSHLQQAFENLLFNARDAIFEMRDHLRTVARKAPAAQRRQALIDAAAWRGRVVIRAARHQGEAWLEVRDNGIGMTDEVRRRCTESLFTTKRDDAKHEGHSTGMGLGLSFVVAILGHHHAKLDIESAPQQGSTFRARFAPAPSEGPSGAQGAAG